jgi:hypothetical protein
MDKDNTLVQVTPDDLAAVERELAKSPKPASTRELAEFLAFRKTADQRTQAVKIYDPTAAYEVGDSIYKEYDEHLTVGSKVVEPFKGAVVLTVVHKTFYKDFGCEMLEVDYTGGGTFRRYVDYMKKSKAQVLLPSNVGGAAAAPQVMGQGADPRLSELPMTDRDLKTLERALRAAMAKVSVFFSWNDSWQLTSSQPEIPEAKVQEIAAHFTETKASAATGDLVRKFFGLEPSSDLFDITCLTLNHLFETKAKKEFLQVSPVDWGKWHLKTALNSMPDGLALSTPEAPMPELEILEKPEPFHEFPLKVYLTWREILAGGVRIPKAYNKELSHSREYTFHDADENKSYTVFFFPQLGYFLGLRDFFASHNIPQGTSMTLERKGPVLFHFWIKKSKKKLSVAKLAYDAATDTFADAGEVATLALPNKIIYLERDTIHKLGALAAGREPLDLKDLLILIFKTFSASATNFALHYLRAYHLVDMLKRTTQEEVELVLLNTSEFSKSDKKKGIYHFHEALPAAPEALPAEAAAAAYVEEEAAAATAPELPEEVEFLEDVEEAGFEFAPVAPPPPPVVHEVHRPAPTAPAAAPAPAQPPAPSPAGAGAAAKKEKPHKKKKPKVEGEKAVRARKSERRVIEERIEDEESEHEALLAEKAADEEFDIAAALIRDQEAPAEEAASEAEAPAAAAEEGAAAKPGAAKPAAGGLFGNLFAEKLKSALVKKRAEDAQKPSEDEEPES